MKSNIIQIDNQGNGFEAAQNETKRVAVYEELDSRQATRLMLITEEMLSLARSITGEMEATFWIEGKDKAFQLHLGTSTVMDTEKRTLLLSTASSRKNEASKTFLGYIRDAFERAMLPDVDHSKDDLPYEVLIDLPNHVVEDQEWDGYEKSVLRRLADNVKISIRGNNVDMTVSKKFE